MKSSTLRLFCALPITTTEEKQNTALVRETLQHGFVFDLRVIANYSYTELSTLVTQVEALYGRSGNLNQSFHKSWAKVRDASTLQLVVEQILHYLTTYGFESLGIYSEDSVYIPQEVLEVPALEEGIHLTVIHGLTKNELKEKLLHLLSTGVALSEETVKDVVDVALFVGWTEHDMAGVKNKEVRAALYTFLGIVPAHPVEFLRYVIYLATGKTLLIKNAKTIAAIQAHTQPDIAGCFARYEREYGLARLAEIFYRYKPLFLALRSTSTSMHRTVNKIRKLATTQHRPLPEDTLNAVTAHLRHESSAVTKEFTQALSSASVFRKIRLAYALRFRTTNADSILYRVRNGKSYATSFDFANQQGAEEAYEAVLSSIVSDVAHTVAGKTVFIPKGVQYGLPATEKQFTGNLPSGTCVSLESDMIVGIHWENVGYHRIDLDLSLISPGGNKFGWDARYRNNERSLLFSGDMTSAPPPDGASELFYVGREARGMYLLSVNYYNYAEDVPVPFKILVAREHRTVFSSHYTVNPNSIVALSSTTMNVQQKTLGILVAEETGSRFYFAEAALGTSRSARGNAYTEQAQQYLLNFYRHAISLNDVLVKAGVTLVETPEEAEIDLSPERLEKTSVLALLKPPAAVLV